MNTLESMRARQRTHAQRQKRMATVMAGEETTRPRPRGPRRVLTDAEKELALDPSRSIQVASELLGIGFGTVARLRQKNRETVRDDRA